MPLRKITHKEFKQKYKPWISNDIFSKIKEKNKNFKKYLNSKNDIRKGELYESFKKLKNDITHETRFSKKRITKSILQSTNANANTMVQSLTGISYPTDF